MNVLVVYGTTEGQTRKIAEHAAERLRDRHHDIDLFDATSLPDALDVAEYEAVLIAASVHQQKHQAAVKHFVQRHREVLNTKPTGFISVSLSAVREDTLPDAQEMADDFFEATDWRPTRIHLAAGALLYTEYDYFKRFIMKTIVRKGGGPTDTGHDYEFTDWDALDEFVDALL